jgi:hypothetical protein
MRTTLAIFCLFAGAASAFAQSGVSTQRDVYGNLVRPNGPYSAKGVNQGPVNNGAINNATVNTAPAQPPTSNARIDRGMSR